MSILEVFQFIVSIANEFKVEQIKIKPKDNFIHFAMKTEKGHIIWGKTKNEYSDLQYPIGITNVSLLHKILSSDIANYSMELLTGKNPVNDKEEHLEIKFQENKTKIIYKLASIDSLDSIVIVTGESNDIHVKNLTIENLSEISKKINLMTGIDPEISFKVDDNELIGISGSLVKSYSEVSLLQNIIINENINLDKSIKWDGNDIKSILLCGKKYDWSNIELSLNNKGLIFVYKENENFILNAKLLGKKI